jgi:MFS transporter, MHS family, proline/betaine transporter
MSVSASGITVARPTEQQSRKAISVATIGNVMEWYDFGVFGFLVGSLALNFFPRDDPRPSLLNTFLIFGVGLVFRPLGGIVIGRLGDRRGRKPALVLTIVMMAAGTVIMGLLPTYSSIGVLAPILLLLARLLQGFSTGGDLGRATVFMAEWSVEGTRGL